MVYNARGLELASPGYLLTAFFIVSNVALMFVPRRAFRQTRFVLSVLAADIILVSLVIYATGGPATDLYLLYLLVIFAALPARSVIGSAVVAVTACVFHASMTYVLSGKESLLQASFLIKIPFLFAVAMFGNLISRQRSELLRQREENKRLTGELKRKLIKAKESKEKLYEDVLMLYDYNDSIVNSLDCGVLVLDLNGTVTAFNRAAGEITGLTCDDVLFSQADMNKTLEAFVGLMNKSLEKPVRRRVLPIETPSGQRKILGISTYLLKQKKEKVGGVIAIFADLTEDRDIKEISGFSVGQERALETLSMSELIDEVVDATIMKAEECRATIEWCPRYALPDVTGDPRLLKSVLSSMILNSLLAVGDGGRIAISTARTDRGVITEVLGDAEDAPGSIQAQIFCPFANTVEDALAETASAKEEPASEQEIDFETMVGSEDDEPKEDSEPTAAGPRGEPGAPRPGKKGKTILVADNDASVRTFYKVILEKAGHSVLLAQDGSEAIRQALGGGVDLLVLELRMPRIDGMQVIEHLGRANPGLRIVVCTGYTAMQSDCVAGNQNVVAYLTKPVSIFEFQRVVERALKDGAIEAAALTSSATSH
jgi:PAS domain S-box-containing protein